MRPQGDGERHHRFVPARVDEDPASSFLLSGYHDVPWKNLRLIRACVGKRWKQKLRHPKENQVQSLSPVASHVYDPSRE